MNPKIALVTGASRGLGVNLAESLIDDGYFVIGVARSPIESWSIHPSDSFHAYQCDINNESQVKHLFSFIRKEYQRLDLLINNAGIFNAELLQGTTATRFEKVLNTNLISVMSMTREAAKIMRKANSGRIITISSVATAIRIPGNANYGLSKRAAEELMLDFAIEFREVGITFNSVRVSFVEETGMAETLSSDARRKYESRLIISRPLQPKEVFHAIKFFASELAGSITGQVLALGSPE